MIELETKIKLRDEKRVLDTLDKMGAEFKYFFKHEDRYYNAPPSLRDFQKTDEALRIRSVHYLSEDGATILEKKHDITYKGPKMDKTVKTRKELVVDINSPDNMHAILEALGFIHVITLIKYRRGYSLVYKGYHIEIVVDRVEELDGVFMEAEIIAESKEDMDAIKSILLEFIGLLGYSEQDCIVDSYLELVLKKKGLL